MLAVYPCVARLFCDGCDQVIPKGASYIGGPFSDSGHTFAYVSFCATCIHQASRLLHENLQSVTDQGLSGVSDVLVFRT